MKAQEIFNRAVRRLIKQGVPATTEYAEGCRYRTDDGRRCAIGHLLPTKVYKPTMENNSVRRLVWKFPEVEPYVLASDLPPEVALRLAGGLQDAHDSQAENMVAGYIEPEEWLSGFRARARLLGEKFKLDTTCCKE